jgi:hypothetical protein
VVAHRQVKRALALAVGWILIGLGIVGLFLPVLQGVLFILLGLYVLSRESRTARRILDLLGERYPHAYAAMQRTKEKMVTAWDRLTGRQHPSNNDVEAEVGEEAESGNPVIGRRRVAHSEDACVVPGKRDAASSIRFPGK